MTKLNFVLIAACLTVGLALGGVAQAQAPKDVNVVNEPNVSVLNNVDVNVTNDTTNPVPVVVQNGTSTPPVKELVEIIQLDVPADNTVDVYTVPSGKQLAITDVIIRGGGTTAPFQIFRDGSIVSRVSIGATVGAQYNHSYVSGIEFQENQVVSIRAPNISDWELRGYQTDIN